MTIGAVGGSRTQVSYESLEDISVGNPMARLARVLLESKDRQEESEDLAFDGAKARVEKHTAEEVDRLHDAADETWKGALTGALLTVGGAALSANAIDLAHGAAAGSDAMRDSKMADVGAKLMSGGAPFADKAFGSRAQDFQADATKARGAAAMARTDMDRADAERKRAINGQDDVASTLKASIKQNHDARMDSIQMIRG